MTRREDNAKRSTGGIGPCYGPAMASTPRRIVCLTEEPTEILCHLGCEDRIVGISGFTVRPKGISRRKPKISAFTSARYDAIEALRPDLVLGFSDLQADLAAELIRRGMQVVIFNQRSVEEILSTIVMTGALVGEVRAAERWAGELETRLDGVRAAAANLPYHPRVYFEEWPDPIITGIRWVEELVEIAGGQPIFPELRNASLAKDRIVTPEAVRERAPELILASWCGRKVERDSFGRREGWASVPAVAADRIVALRSSEILQPGPAALTDGLDRIVQAVRGAAESCSGAAVAASPR